MDSIAVSKFKSTCLAVLERVRRTRKSVVVTRFGEPIAEIVPPAPPERPSTWLGCMRDRGQILGDLTDPAEDASAWEALNP